MNALMPSALLYDHLVTIARSGDFAVETLTHDLVSTFVGQIASIAEYVERGISSRWLDEGLTRYRPDPDGESERE